MIHQAETLLVVPTLVVTPLVALPLVALPLVALPLVALPLVVPPQLVETPQVATLQVATLLVETPLVTILRPRNVKIYGAPENVEGFLEGRVYVQIIGLEQHIVQKVATNVMSSLTVKILHQKRSVNNNF